MTNDTHDTNMAFAKMGVAWVGAFIGSITLQELVLGLTAIYTVIQLYVLIRDKIWRDKWPRS